jgi:hypothetical protein
MSEPTTPTGRRDLYPWEHEWLHYTINQAKLGYISPEEATHRLVTRFGWSQWAAARAVGWNMAAHWVMRNGVMVDKP